MIFVTVGTQEPFDRLIKVIDHLAENIDEEIIVQAPLGENYTPKNIKPVRLISPTEFERIFNSARVIIAHAGMGTIITAMTLQKPLIIFPRKAALGEHRNDHQSATAEKMKTQGIAGIAQTYEEITTLLKDPDILTPKQISATPSKALTDAIASFIDE